jgi:hypothetical protein
LAQALAGVQQQRTQLDALNAQGAAGLGAGLGSAVSTIGQSIFGPESVFAQNTPQGRQLAFTRGAFEQGKEQLVAGGMPEDQAHQKMVAQYQQGAADLLKTYADTDLAKAATETSKQRGKLLGAQATDLEETRESRLSEQQERARGLQLANALTQGVIEGQISLENAKAKLATDLATSPKALDAALAELDARVAKAEEVTLTKDARIKAANAELLAAESTASVTKALNDLREQDMQTIFEVELDKAIADKDKVLAETEHIKDLRIFTQRQLDQVDRDLAAKIVQAKANHDIKSQQNIISSRASLVQGYAQLVAPLVRMQMDAQARGQELPYEIQQMNKEIFDKAKEGLVNAINDLLINTVEGYEVSQTGVGRTRKVGTGDNSAGFDEADRRIAPGAQGR